MYVSPKLSLPISPQNEKSLRHKERIKSLINSNTRKTSEHRDGLEIVNIVNSTGQYKILIRANEVQREDFFSSTDGYSREFENGILLFELWIDYINGVTERTEFDYMGRIRSHNRTNGPVMVRDVSYEYFKDYALVTNHLSGKCSMRLYDAPRGRL
ncbi:MAG: hypothetical protein K2X93_00295 [Candidatus Obscuribacterales bacterium]|nr:hypothetical protein [Candidatus Obscuribacterales bacterium]